MSRTLTIPLAVAALAVSAAPASAVTSENKALSVDTDADGLSDSYETSSAAKRKARSSTLRMYRYDGSPTAKYYLENAWPSKVEISG
jgi:hypothetical protein